MGNVRGVAFVVYRANTGNQADLDVGAPEQKAPKSEGIAPPSNSARIVNPAAAGKRSWLGIELFIGGLV